MIKMSGTIAVPGEFTYGDVTEIKTAEELKDAAFRHPIVTVSYGHTMDGLMPPANMQIGTISQKWSEEEQKVLGEMWLHEEKIPEKLRQKIDDGKNIPISAGIMLESVDEEGTQRGITYTHIAVVDGEDPKCPLGVCGMNVRLESDRLVRLEQSTEIDPPEPKAEKETEAPPVEADSDEYVEALKKQPASVIGDPVEPEQPKPEEPAEQKPEETDEQAPEEEVKLEPEVLIPAEIVTVRKEFEIIDGKYVFVPQAFKQKQEKED